MNQTNSYDQNRRRHRLYRNGADARLAGVCAGVAEYFGFNRTAVRFLTLVAFIAFFPLAPIAYLVLALILPKRPDSVATRGTTAQDPAQAGDQEQKAFWRDVNNAPGEVFGNIKHRLRSLELRLQRMEAYVTSTDYEFDRKLGRGDRSSSTTLN